MSVAIETAELIAALQAASKEAQDVIEATEDATDGDLAALGHNGVRDAAKDAHNICNNLVRRLGGLAIEAKKPEPVEQPIPEPEPEPEVSASEAMLDELEAVKTKLDDRLADPLEVSEEPPEEIADLFDAGLTARQNQEALQKKYAETMSMREIHLANGEDSEAMALLKKAERYDSGIKWNRARLAEVI